MSRGPRLAEEWARRVIEEATGWTVAHHDDNSAPRMFDLIARDPRGEPVAAIEVTTITDPEWTETWNSVPGDGFWPQPGLQSAWMIELRQDANLRALKTRLGPFLQTLEAEGVDAVRGDWYFEHDHPETQAAAGALGLVSARRLTGGTPGDVFPTVEMRDNGGAVNATGEGFVDWLYETTAHEDFDHNRVKLSVGFPRREVFLPVSMPGASWEINSYLCWLSERDGPRLPTEPARLPDPLTGAWIVSTSTPDYGLRWDGASWSFFRARGEPFERLWASAAQEP